MLMQALQKSEMHRASQLFSLPPADLSRHTLHNTLSLPHSWPALLPSADASALRPAVLGLQKKKDSVAVVAAAVSMRVLRLTSQAAARVAAAANLLTTSVKLEIASSCCGFALDVNVRTVRAIQLRVICLPNVSDLCQQLEPHSLPHASNQHRKMMGSGHAAMLVDDDAHPATFHMISPLLRCCRASRGARRSLSAPPL